MQVEKETIEKVTITYQPDETKEALEYCSQNRYRIVDMYAIIDGRSGHYLGGVILTAERVTTSG